MHKLFIMIALGSTLASCASTKAFRNPAQESLPPVKSTRLALYSWSNNPAALSNPVAAIADKLQKAQACVAKIAAAGEDGPQIPGCEGNEMAAGPGVYTCDNPFTSHDYGNILLVMDSVGGSSRVGNGTGLRPADEMDRSLTGNADLDGILYDFRFSDLNTRALVVRASAMIDLPATRAIDARPAQWKKFREHPAFECAAATPIAEILKNWGDQLEFMSHVFLAANDPEGKGFLDEKGNLSASGMLAATSSDTVALSDADLQARISSLSNSSREVKESLAVEACEETDAKSPRHCFFQRVLSSINGDLGTDSHPTHAWSFKTTIAALSQINFLVKDELKKVPNQPKLAAYLAWRFAQDPGRLARAREAFGCVSTFKLSLEKNNFAHWAADSF